MLLSPTIKPQLKNYTLFLPKAFYPNYPINRNRYFHFMEGKYETRWDLIIESLLSKLEKISVTYKALKTRIKLSLVSVVLWTHLKTDFLLFIFMNICISLASDYFISPVLCLVKSRGYIVWFLGTRNIPQTLKVSPLVLWYL